MTDPIVKQALFESASRHNFVPLGFLSSDFRSIYTTIPVENFEDMQKLRLRLRTMPSQTYIEMLGRFGAVATLLPFGELYSAMQQGVVDGAEGGLAGIYQAKFGEVAKYALVTEHTRLTDFVVTSMKFQNSLSPHDLAIVNEEFEKVSLKSVAYAEQNEATSMKKAEDEMGVIFVRVDKTPFIQAVVPMYRAAREDEAKRLLLEAIFESQGREF
jgi:TRAP-type C4-dicarboxylate transport system substrate-binding protein